MANSKALGNAFKLHGVVNVKDPAYGAKGDNSTDDTTAIQAAINALPSTGGIVIFPPGDYCISSSLNLGNGDASTDSTVNAIALVGAGSGTGSGFTSLFPTGATRLKWIGSSGTGPMVQIAGPCRNMRVEDIQLDGNDLASIGLSVIHCAFGTFRRVNVRKWRSIAFQFTTRSGVPASVAHGNADLVIDNCGCAGPSVGTASAVLLDSGYATSGSVTYDTTRAVFTSGSYIWGGDTGSYGFKFHGADNNCLIDLVIIRSSLSTNSSDAILFTQWTGDTTFPKENAFVNVIISGGTIGGTSGTTGNLFIPLPTDDLSGGVTPTLGAYLYGITYRGQFVGPAGTGTPWRLDSADSASNMLWLNRAAGNARYIGWTTALSKRWEMGANSTTESGANAGSNFNINRYDDSAVLLGTAIQIVRADGTAKFEANIDLTAGTTPGSIIMTERGSAPSAPAANGCILYCIDSGAGKTQLMAIFNTGSPVQVAIQP